MRTQNWNRIGIVICATGFFTCCYIYRSTKMETERPSNPIESIDEDKRHNAILEYADADTTLFINSFQDQIETDNSDELESTQEIAGAVMIERIWESLGNLQSQYNTLQSTPLKQEDALYENTISNENQLFETESQKEERHNMTRQRAMQTIASFSSDFQCEENDNTNETANKEDLFCIYENNDNEYIECMFLDTYKLIDGMSVKVVTLNDKIGLLKGDVFNAIVRINDERIHIDAAAHGLHAYDSDLCEGLILSRGTKHRQSELIMTGKSIIRQFIPPLVPIPEFPSTDKKKVSITIPKGFVFLMGRDANF